jgi:broad specificity phosphatase PhoE
MHGLSVVVLHDLRERRLAEATLEEQAFLETIKHSRRDPGFRLPGGESTDEVRRRAFDALDRIHDEARSGVVVAGTHGGVISIVRWSLGIEFTVEQALEDPMPAVYRLWRERRRWLADEVRQNEP